MHGLAWLYVLCEPCTMGQSTFREVGRTMFRMDWGAIASNLAERSAHPIALIDNAGRIRLLNRAMELAFGFTRFHVEGQLWARTFVPPDSHHEAQRWIAEALRGALRSYETTIVNSAGARLPCRLEFSLVGRGHGQAVLLTVTEVLPPPAPQGPLDGCDLDYEVATADAEVGTITRLTIGGEAISLGASMRCYALIHGLDEPCAECPIRNIDDSPSPRTAVRGAVGGFTIKSAERVDDRRVRVRLRQLTDRTLEAVHAAKIDQLSARADLSPREREVLSFLLLGRSIEDIAREIGISNRTVKYHQANVLQKLGAESRVDLVRLLF